MPQLRKKLTAGFRVASSRDGSSLVCLGSNAVVFNVADRLQVCRIRPFPHLANTAFSPDGRLLVVKNTLGRIATIDPYGGGVVLDFKNGKEGEGSDVLFSPDADALVDGSWAGVLTVRTVKDGTIIAQEKFPGEMISRISHDSSGRMWLIQHQPKVRPGENWPEPTYLVLRTWPFAAHPSRVLRFAFKMMESASISPDGAFVCFVSKDEDWAIRIVSVVDGKTYASSAPIRIGRTRLAWSPNGNYIGSVQKGKFVVYRAVDLSVIAEVLCQHPSDICFMPDGELVALGSWNSSVLASLTYLIAGKVRI